MTDANFLKVREVATALSISPIAANQLINKGRLRAVNVGSGDKRPSWRVAREDLDAFIERQRTGGAPEGDAA